MSASPLIFSNTIQPIFLAIIFIIINTATINNDSFKGIHSQERLSYGTILFPISYLLLILFFWDYTEYLIISLLILAICDPLAAQFGQLATNQNTFIIWNDKKTIIGTIAFFFSSFIIVYTFGSIFFNNSNIYLLGLALFTAFGTTISEITSSKGSDNLSIPFVSILFMIGYSEHFLNNGNFAELLNIKIYILILIVFIFSISYYLKSVSRSGFYGGLIMGILITMYGGWVYVFPLGLFFILSSILGKIVKELSFQKVYREKRDIIQVYANGGICLLLCIISFFLDSHVLILPMFLASVASATADTWGTEFGKISKKLPISIITFKTVEHGMSGGITVIGTIGSFIGATIISLASWLLLQISIKISIAITLIGFVSAILDSILGAIAQAKFETQNGEIIENQISGANLISGYKWIDNNMVNLLNTLIAPIIMFLYLTIFNL
tara:strand:+ start:132 stop:1454 length:1323 start_codon:yes stop_codon:yes gene_type:complete